MPIGFKNLTSGDYDKAINPNSIELCNRVDDNCDGIMTVLKHGKPNEIYNIFLTR
jgi:hypothetical protein